MPGSRRKSEKLFVDHAIRNNFGQNEPMKVSGFSYVRNGILYDYPFLESIQSILPLCDEFIMVVGDSTDGTREAIEALNDPKIRIVDTIWSEDDRAKGHLFSNQANIGLDHCTGDWAFHIQADEVVHEKDLPVIQQAMQEFLHKEEVEGFLFHFVNFFGDYWHYGPSRRFHNKEIRIVRNDRAVRSYRDSQGFRKFEHPDKQHEEKGMKLAVKLIDATIYHYSYVKDPETQRKKQYEFVKRYKSDEELQTFFANLKPAFDYNKIDILEKYTGSHPAIMKDRIDKLEYKFTYDPTKSNMSLKEKLLYFIQKKTGKQLFAYKNYRII